MNKITKIKVKKNEATNKFQMKIDEFPENHTNMTIQADFSRSVILKTDRQQIWHGFDDTCVLSSITNAISFPHEHVRECWFTPNHTHDAGASSYIWYLLANDSYDFSQNINMKVNANQPKATERGALEIILDFEKFESDEQEFEIELAFGPWILDDYWQLFTTLLFICPIFIYFMSFSRELSKRRRQHL